MTEARGRVLVVDDQRAHAEASAEGLERVGFECRVAESGEEGLEALAADEADVVVTDLVMKGMGGIDLLRAVKERYPETQVIVLSGQGGVQEAVRAMKEGAHFFLEKPLQLEQLRETVRNAIQTRDLRRDILALRRQISSRYGFEAIVGTSPPMRSVVETIAQIADTSATVLITGESGTGKELVAKTIHQNSSRRERPFVGLNCAALSETILESELFGHEKGAFTGAVSQRKGRFEYADGGTLFLDEVGDMPITTQIKLLRVLEEREIVRVGSNEPLKVDVRLIAATNANLERAVEERGFRTDLYYRLKVVSLALPPLRARSGDLPLLIDTFLREFSRRHGKQVTGMSAAARKALARHGWPGNVRELRNCIENMVVTAKGETLEAEDIPADVAETRDRPSGVAALAGMTMAEVERELIQATLAMVGGNREEAARILGIGERTLYRRIKEYSPH